MPTVCQLKPCGMKARRQDLLPSATLPPGHKDIISNLLPEGSLPGDWNYTASRVGHIRLTLQNTAPSTSQMCPET